MRDGVSHLLRWVNSPPALGRSLAPLLFRVGKPTGPGTFTEIKEMKAIGNHPLNDVWEDKLAPLVLDILESKSVKFTSVDVVRIGIAEEPVESKSAKR